MYSIQGFVFVLLVCMTPDLFAEDFCQTKKSNTKEQNTSCKPENTFESSEWRMPSIYIACSEVSQD